MAHGVPRWVIAQIREPGPFKDGVDRRIVEVEVEALVCTAGQDWRTTGSPSTVQDWTCDRNQNTPITSTEHIFPKVVSSSKAALFGDVDGSLSVRPPVPHLMRHHKPTPERRQSRVVPPGFGRGHATFEGTPPRKLDSIIECMDITKHISVLRGMEQYRRTYSKNSSTSRLQQYKWSTSGPNTA